MTREGQPQSNKVHRGRKLNSLPLQCKYTNGQNDDSQNALKQCNINKRSTNCTIDLKDFYLNTLMERPEYMRMKLSNLPQEFVDMYNLTKIAEENGNVYIKIQ